VKPLSEVRVAVWISANDGLSPVETALSHLQCRVDHASSYQHLWELMEQDLDLIVASCQSAPEVLRWMKDVSRAGSSPPPVLTVATSNNVEEYLHAMALGAFDCVALPIEQRELGRLIDRAIQERHAEPLLLSA